MRGLFPEKLTRGQYFTRWLIYIFIVAIGVALALPAVKYLHLWGFVPVAIIFFIILFRIPCIDIPRLRSIGWSPWLALLFLVPFVNFIFQLLLFFIPPKENGNLTTAPPLIQQPSWMQHNWKWFVPALIVLGVGFLVAVTIIGEHFMKSCGAYTEAVARVESNPDVITALGTPVHEGFFLSGTISENDSWRNAHLTFFLNGPKGSATVYVVASKTTGPWQFDTLIARINQTQQQIDILATNR